MTTRLLETLRSLVARARETISRRRVAQELDDEMRFHLELEIEHNVARGMTPHDARRAAQLAFGGVQRYREETRDARGFAWLDAAVRDTRFTLRRLRRSPVFAVGVIGTLAVGLGAATGIAALVYGVMLRPLPYSDPDRLVRITVATPGFSVTSTAHSAGTYLFISERARAFTKMGGYFENNSVTITDGPAPERTTSTIITPSVFAILGTRAALGRVFRDEDATADTLPVLISYEIWQRRFGGDPSVLDRRIEVNRGRRRIVGVLPEGFDFPSRAAGIYYPHEITASRASLTDRYIDAVARLAPGVTPEAAEREIATLAAHIGDRFPELTADAIRQSGLRFSVRSMRSEIVAPVRAELLLLGIMACVVLLIASTNVATLFLLRAERLRGEVAVSRALGAGTGSLVRRFVVEGLVVALLAGVAAVPVVAIALSTKFGFDTTQIPRLHEVQLTPGLAFALFGAALLVGAGLGLVAFARAGDAPPISPMAESRTTGTRAWRRTQQAMVSVQIALALALLLGAALMGESFARLRRVNVGFDASGAASFAIAVPFSAYPRYQNTVGLHYGIMDRLSAIPGVTGVAGVMQMPLTPREFSNQQRITTHDGTRVEATGSLNLVTPSYFGVMGIPLRAGRTFARGDFLSPSPSVILSGTLARDLFGSANPVGRHLRLATSARYPSYRVVGVVGDVYGARIADGVRREMYFPLIDDLPRTSADTISRVPFNPSGLHYIVRSNAPLGTLAPSFRAAVAAEDARVPIAEVRTLDGVVSAATARTRLTMMLLSIAAAATLVLGAVGLYSVIAYAVAGRAPEFAVRLALGATSPAIMGLVFREGLLVASVGVAGGVALSVGGARFIRGVLYEVSAANPWTAVAAAVVLAITAIVAMYVPARRAGRTDPARVLRGP